MSDMVPPQLTLCGSLIRVVSQIKFFGMIFDDRLTSYLPHTVNLKPSCHRSLDILRHLSSTTCGEDSRTLFNLYITMVQS